MALPRKSSYLMGGTYDSVAPTLNDGDFNPLELDVNGNLKVNVVAGGSGSNASVGLTGATAPTSATEIGVVDSTGKLQHVTGLVLTNALALTVAIVDGSGNQITSFGGGVQFADAAASGAHPTGTQIIGWNKGATTELAITALSLTNAQALEVAIVDGSGNQITTFGGGTQFADNAASGATPTGTLEMGWDSINSKIRALKVDLLQNLWVNAGSNESFVQGNNIVGNATLVTSTTIAFTNPNAYGNLLFLVVRDGGFAVSSVTDSAGNAWTQIDAAQNTEFCSAWYAPNSIAGANTVTINFAGNSNFIYAAVGEYTGVATMSPVNTHSITTGTSNFALPTAIAAQTGDLVLGYTENHLGVTYTAADNYTLRQNSIAVAFEDSVNAATGSFAPAFNMSASAAWVAGAVAFQAAPRTAGVAYGSQGQQLKQTPVNFNLQVELATGSTLYDARQIRALTSADVVSAVESGLWNVNQAIGVAGFEKITDGTNTAAVKASNSAAVKTDPALVVSLSPNSAVSIKTGNSISNWTGLNLAGLNPGHVVIIDSSGSGTVPAVKAASTAAVAADPALVVAISPNNTIPVSGTVTANQGTAAVVTAGWPIIGGQLGESTASWTSGTSSNTTLAITVTGYNTVSVTLNQGTTITGGVVTFEVSDTLAGTNWYPILGTQSQAFVTGSTYTLQASTNQAFQFDVSGYVQFRVRLSTAISGTGTVNVGIIAQAASTDSAVVVGITDGTTGPVAVKAGSTLAVAADQALVVAVSPNNTIPSNITQWASTVLGVPQTFGTVPTGVVIGTSSDIYVSGTRARSNQTTTAAGVQDVNITGVLGVTNSVTNGLFCAITDNTTKVGVIVGTTALKTDMSSVAGTATVTAAAGVQKVGIVGNTGAVLDAVITAATAPSNALATLSVNQTTAPSLTTGQSVARQADYQGSIFVKPYRRGQTVSKATTISAITATTVLAAQAAGIFADIATFVLTATPIATSVATTATLSDGTNSYIFDFIPGTATALGSDPVIISFNPPLPATTAATAWTLTMSTANTVHITVVAVLQKAS